MSKLLASVWKFSGLSGSAPAPKVSRAPTFHLRVRGTLYVKPKDTNVYKPITEIGGASFVIVSNDSPKRDYRIQILEDGADEPALEQDVEGMTLTYHHGTGSVMWATMIEDEIQEFAFRAQVEETARASGVTEAGQLSRAIVETYNRCLYGSLTNDNSYVDKGPSAPFLPSAVAATGIPPSVTSSANAEEEDDDNDFRYVTAPRTLAATNIREGSPDAVAPETDDDEDIALFRMDNRASSVCPTPGTPGNPGKNVCFADSVQYSRTIVFRDEGKGRVRATATEFNSSAHNFQNQQSFLIEDMGNLAIGNDCLSSADERRMYLHNTAGPTGVCELDLEVGKVVQEYKPAANYAVNSIAYAAKDAKNEPNLITCLSNNVAFSIDKRLDPRNCVVAEAGKSTADYALASSTPKFICHATSDNGFLAIGSISGDIRLYSGVPGSQRAKGHQPKTAKTLLKGNSKNPIVHIDITHDGKFILAVTPTYLMVLPTEYVSTTGKATNGFEGRMGKDKPVPMSLNLSADQIRQMGGKIPPFKTARFESSGGGNSNGDEWIVAACGTFIVTWSMESIKKSYARNVRTVENGEISSESKTLNAVNMLPLQRGSEIITFMTDDSIGMVPRLSGSENTSRKRGFTYFN